MQPFDELDSLHRGNANASLRRSQGRSFQFCLRLIRVMVPCIYLCIFAFLRTSANSAS